MMTFPLIHEPSLELWYPEAQNFLQYLFHHPNHPEMLFRLKDLITMTYSSFYNNKLLETRKKNTLSQCTEMRQVLASKAFCLGTHTHAVKTLLDFCESLYLLRPALMYEEYCLLWYTREISPVSCPPMLYLRIYTSDRLVWIWILKIVSTFTVQNWSSSDLKARATNNCLNLSFISHVKITCE